MCISFAVYREHVAYTFAMCLVSFMESLTRLPLSVCLLTTLQTKKPHWPTPVFGKRMCVYVSGVLPLIYVKGEYASHQIHNNITQTDVHILCKHDYA